MNFTPDYLTGKSAIEILDEFEVRHRSDDETTYIGAMRHHLLVAILHALCACDEDGSQNEPNAAGRACAFLNAVLPYEPKP